MISGHRQVIRTACDVKLASPSTRLVSSCEHQEMRQLSEPASHLVRSHMQMGMPVDSLVIRQFGPSHDIAPPEPGMSEVGSH